MKKSIIFVFVFCLVFLTACSLEKKPAQPSKNFDKKIVVEKNDQLASPSVAGNNDNSKITPLDIVPEAVLQENTVDLPEAPNTSKTEVIDPSSENEALKQCDLMEEMVGGPEVVNHYRDACYALVAKNLKSIGVCYFIKEIDYRRQCYNYFISNFNNNCDSINKEVVKNDCLTVTVITNPVNVESGVIVDPRDQHKYKWVKINDQTWLAENLAYDNGCSQKTWVNRQDVGWCGYYENNKEKYAYRGLLYQWSAAMNNSEQVGAQGICPPGWHVPSDEEFSKLETYLGVTSEEISNIGWIDSGKVGKKLKAISWGGTDDYSFSVIPSGFRYSDGTFNFVEAGEFTGLWSSSPFGFNSPENGEGVITKDSWYRLFSEEDGINRNFLGYASANSLRCLKD